MPKTHKRRRRQSPENNVQPLFREFKPRTRNQAEYIRAIIESDITFCIGPAGCGKTAVAIGIAVQHLYEGKVDRLIITKPTVECGPKSLGFLPGTINDKLFPHIKNLYEELESFLGKSRLDNYIRDKIIEIVPLEYMRGTTFNNGIMIMDEGQNASLKQLTMFLTRLGNGSKAIINGDIEQTDLIPQLSGGFEKYLKRMPNIEGVSIVELDESDIQRHPVVSRIIYAMRENNDNTSSSGTSTFK